MNNIYTARRQQAINDTNLLYESLRGVQSSDERANGILSNALRIIKNKQSLQTEELSQKQIEKIKLSSSDCERAMRANLVCLNADNAYINQMMTYINDGDIKGVHLHLLTLLAKRNPGLYARKLSALQMASKQK